MRRDRAIERAGCDETRGREEPGSDTSATASSLSSSCSRIDEILLRKGSTPIDSLFSIETELRVASEKAAYIRLFSTFNNRSFRMRIVEDLVNASPPPLKTQNSLCNRICVAGVLVF